MLKRELRTLMRQKKGQFTQQQLCELSLPIVDRIKPMLAGVETIVAYYSLPDEVDTHDFIDWLIAEGKTVYLPKVISDEDMVLCRYTGAESLCEGAFGIMEPVGEELLADEAIDVVLVPGMAFDGEGNRLGRGKGYYDRFLKSLTTPRPKLIGVCFDFQKVDMVPTEPTDVKVDVVV
ncbi:MAG: 5-formyltetrahydrofolate cyclo-ligase [Prevotella ruminicola]|jgi:5-formyltetrahydrofolate cyclo-ligase|uniref:5-formyltetrahydrofolate cyclo-ligase n=1 Tax=Xylanibacter ruminicola TaxID=839 RepID=A0A928GHX5_XYLRU|nr:5-formyltetrahydrofolate cyclo-ligase [Xylanibacter ruminicola]